MPELHARDWEPKAAICLECRTVVDGVEGCGQDSHHTTDLRSTRGRERPTHGLWYQAIDSGVPLAYLTSLGRFGAVGILLLAMALLVLAVAHAGSLTTAALMMPLP